MAALAQAPYQHLVFPSDFLIPTINTDNAGTALTMDVNGAVEFSLGLRGDPTSQGAIRRSW